MDCHQAGLDSLGAVELRNAIGDRFAMRVPATLAFDRPNLASLLEFVADSQPGRPKAKMRAPGAAEVDVAGAVMAAVRGVLGQAISSDQPLLEVSPCSTIHHNK